MKRIFNRPVAPPEYSLDQKIVLGSALWLVLSINFTLNYLTHTYYSGNVMEMESPGFWLFMLNNVFLAGILFFVKKTMRWKWSDLGLARPTRWWKPVLMSLLVFAGVVLFAKFLQPLIIETFGSHQNISHLYTLRGNLPRLISALFTIWVTAAFLEEIIFRAFVINTLEDL
ncbi:hypothetical protein, partial [Longispora fulva]